MSTWASLNFPWASRPYRLYEEPETPYLNEEGLLDFKPDDEENPRNWSFARRWCISLISVFLVLNGTFASSIPSGCLTSISEEFQVSETAASVSLTLFLLGYCEGPFIFAPLSEFYGRRWMLYINFIIYLAFTILCAFPPNFAGFLIGRFFAGTFVSGPLCNAPGILADLWEFAKRDNSMAIFAVAVWAGPSLGPIVASFLDEALGWRWGFYVVLMMGAVAALLMFTIPETHAPTILKEKARKIRDQKLPGHENVQSPLEAHDMSLLQTYKVALLRPWALLFDPISFLCAIYMAIVFMLQYMLFGIYPIIFEDLRGWSTSIAELPLLGSVVGSFIAAGIIFYDTRRRNKMSEKGQEVGPEEHLWMAMIGGVGFPVTMFWFAWTGQYPSIHWFVPTLAGTFLSASLMLIFVAYINYLVASYSQYAASLVAVNTFARSLGSAAAPLFTTFMFDALKVGGGGSLIGGVATLLAVIPFVFYRYGRVLRIKSKYAPTGTDMVHPRDEEEGAAARDLDKGGAAIDE